MTYHAAPETQGALPTTPVHATRTPIFFRKGRTEPIRTLPMPQTSRKIVHTSTADFSYQTVATQLVGATGIPNEGAIRVCRNENAHPPSPATRVHPSHALAAPTALCAVLITEHDLQGAIISTR